MTDSDPGPAAPHSLESAIAAIREAFGWSAQTQMVSDTAGKLDEEGLAASLMALEFGKADDMRVCLPGLLSEFARRMDDPGAAGLTEDLLVFLVLAAEAHRGDLARLGSDRLRSLERFARAIGLRFESERGEQAEYVADCLAGLIAEN